MNPPPGPAPDSTARWPHWESALRRLAGEIRDGVGAVLRSAAAGDVDRDSVAEVIGVGAGDITFAIDEVAEDVVTRWFAEESAKGPLSLMTEDAGWRHWGPPTTPGGPPTELDSFDHGGPRIGLDPIDGTRNIMHDLRSAWVVISAAGPGPAIPRFDDLQLGIVSEIPDTRAAVARELSGMRGRGAEVREIAMDGATQGESRYLGVDSDARIDRGYFPFFAFHPECRADVAGLGHKVMAAVHRAAGTGDLATVFDDQYISSGGQLALLALGKYRTIVDARTAVGALTGRVTQTAKPYDMAGAVLMAQEAGCVVVAPDGAPLDFPLDVETSVDFAGFHNRATAGAVLPHLVAAVGLG